MKKSKLYQKLNQESEEIGFFKKIKSIKTENNNYKKYARREMEGYFVENRSKKEKKNKEEKHIITREEVENSVKEFLDKGGTINKIGYLEKYREKEYLIINHEADEQDSDFIQYSNFGFQIESL